MIPVDNSPILSRNQDAFVDLASLNKVKQKGREDDPAALREVARQFEAVFVQQMLKSMRAANEVFSEDSIFNSSEMQFHQQMYDQQMSLELTRGQGFGLGDAIYRQLQQAHGQVETQPQKLAELPPPIYSRPVIAPMAAPVITASAGGGKTSAADSPQDFIAMLQPHAEKAAAELNTTPDVLLAQAALETGWGKHVIHTSRGENSFNLFNIKAGSSWQGGKVSVNTLEYENGLPGQQRAEFRRYNSYEESFNDYINLLRNNPRYEQVLQAGENTSRYAEALQQAGYATDPRYAAKIKNILQQDVVKTSVAMASLDSDASQP